MDLVYMVLAALFGYLLGAIPFGFLFVKVTKGIDLRDEGSGRTGATNSLRAAGLTVFFLTFLMDIVKGAAAIWITRAILGNVLPPNYLPWAEAAAGVMSVIGHNWSIFLKFGGGAGTGPNIGWTLAVWWPAAIMACIIGGALLYGVGMASVASLAVAALIPIIFAIRYFMGDISAAYMVGGLITAAIVTWALRPNIKRILAGEERLVGPAAKRREKRESVES